MFDTSWGETFVLTGIVVGIVGRKDLPAAANFMGKQIGRVVGLLQGVRAYADKYAGSHKELRALQDELRSGLREIDSVKGELAVAASSRGLMGRNFAQPRNMQQVYTDVKSIEIPQTPLHGATKTVQPPPNNLAMTGTEYLELARSSEGSAMSSAPSNLELAPRSQCVAAVAEEEWEKQGIGFKSIGETGSSTSLSTTYGDAKGSEILSDLIQQSLIHDQYDHVVKEQDEALQTKIDKIRKDFTKDS